VSLLELTSAYAAVLGGRYPVVARGLPEAAAPEGLSAIFHSGGSLDPRRDRAPMLDLLYAAANEGTGKRAALATPTFGKTGTTQDNRDALFVGFAGNLVVGVWVGRDDDKSLGKVTGGSVPAKIWRSFMTSALAIDGSQGPPVPQRYARKREERLKSPLPPDWSNSTKPLRQLAQRLHEIFG
jgi:penicillin-binding protein 1A